MLLIFWIKLGGFYKEIPGGNEDFEEESFLRSWFGNSTKILFENSSAFLSGIPLRIPFKISSRDPTENFQGVRSAAHPKVLELF